jgi:hypothetical protein
MKFHCLAVALALLSNVGQAAASEPVTELRRTYSATVDVDEAGKVTRVDLDTSVPKGLVDVMKQAAALARFEPALLDGVPAPSRTLLNVNFRMTSEDGDLRAEVVGLSGGGGKLQSQPPVYPTTALRAGVGARAWVRVSFGTDGRLVPAQSGIESLELVRSDGRLKDSDRKRYDRQFRQSVETMMAKWVFTPDQVAGRAIAASVWVPVTFCPPADQPCSASWTDDPARRPTLPAALDASVRLAVIKPAAAPEAEG